MYNARFLVKKTSKVNRQPVPGKALGLKEGKTYEIESRILAAKIVCWYPLVECTCSNYFCGYRQITKV
jgi:hypothetical protein